MPHEAKLFSKSWPALILALLIFVYVYDLLFLFPQTTSSKSFMYSVAFTCALQLSARYPVRNVDSPLPQMGVSQHPRLWVGDTHWQTALEVVIPCVSHNTAISPYDNYLLLGGIQPHFQNRLRCQYLLWHPLFSTNQLNNLAAGLVPFCHFCVRVRSSYCLVPSRTSWVNEP